MSPHEHGTGAGAAGEVRVLDLLAVVLRRWRLVAATALVVVLAAVALTMLAPKRYTATVLMLPPQEQQPGGQAAMLASQFSGLPGLGSLGGSSSQEVIGVIARSRALHDSLVGRLAGKGARAADAAAVRLMLARHVDVEEKADGSVSVQVSGRDPALAARVANEFPPLINQISAQIGAEAALHKEAFLEGQLRRAQARLERSEEALVAYQRGRNAPDIQEQARQTVDAAAEMQTQIAAQERRVSQLSRSLTPDNPALRAAQAELSTMRSQLGRLTAGGGGQLFVPFRESADLKAQITRLTREYAKDEKIYLSLTAALAETQIDVNNDLPVVSVLDRAEAPADPSGVGLKLVIVVAGLLGGVLGLVAAFVVERLARARRDPEDGAFFDAWEQFKGDLAPGRGRRRKAAPHTPAP
jgi:uncharacterized protein involved in exopolysaccharide biosynthesis